MCNYNLKIANRESLALDSATDCSKRLQITSSVLKRLGLSQERFEAYSYRIWALRSQITSDLQFPSDLDLLAWDTTNLYFLV